MTFWVSLVRGALLLLVGLMLGGCMPSSQGQLEDEKEAHFLRGKSRAKELDFAGAVDAFQKALEANPQNASAHFELGVLFQQRQVADPAAAIYHYSRYLKLRPQAPNAEIVKQMILACKQELARAVWVGPLTEKVQREIEQLTEENRRLALENKQLLERLEQWRTYVGSLQSQTNDRAGGPKSEGRVLAPEAEPSALSMTGQVPVLRTNLTVDHPSRPGPGSGSRTHTVKPGETLTTIARQYGVKVAGLQAANPRADPRRLRVGQTLVVPAP